MQPAISIREVQDMVDHAAKQNDRYLMILAGAILVIVLVVFLWFQSKQIKALFDQVVALYELNSQEMKSDREASNEIIKANTVALTRVADNWNYRQVNQK